MSQLVNITYKGVNLSVEGVHTCMRLSCDSDVPNDPPSFDIENIFFITEQEQIVDVFKIYDSFNCISELEKLALEKL